MKNMDFFILTAGKIFIPSMKALTRISLLILIFCEFLYENCSYFEFCYINEMEEE